MERGTFFLHQGANPCTRRGFCFFGGDYYWEVEIFFFCFKQNCYCLATTSTGVLDSKSIYLVATMDVSSFLY